MRLRLGTFGLLAAASVLASCGPAFESQRVFDEAKRTTPTGDAYHQALYGGYMEHATFEQDEMMNYTSAISHSRNAMMAARGETPAVAELNSFRPLPSDKVDELGQARAQLVAALDDNGAQLQPEAAALAQTYFACWVEQQGENFQPRDIAYCRDGFYKNLAIVNDAVVPVAPETTSLQADAFFDFDKYFIREDAKPELDRIAEVMIADTQTQFLVWGFTDTVGTVEYNQLLSERRANAVADYLAGRGVSRDRMEVKGFGKQREFLAVQTPDQTREPLNRRVEIRRR